MPFLDENEWRQIQPYLGNAAQEIKEYRSKHGCDLETARLNIKTEATQKFQELTGMPGVHFEAIYHHRLSDWGAECNSCGSLFRTPKASFCANCGKTKNSAPNMALKHDG